MAHKIFLGFKAVFENEDYSENDFLKKIPKKLAIGICSYMGSKLYMRQFQGDVQMELLNFLIRRQPQEFKIHLYQKVRIYLKEGGQIFLSLYFNVFLKYCLDKCNDFEYDDTDINNDLLILKSYLNQADIFNSSFSITSNSKNQNDYFRINNWPLYLGQIHHNSELNPLTTFFKGILILDYFKKSEKWKEAYYKYLDHYKVSSHSHFLQILLNCIMEAITNNGQFFIKTDEFGINFFSNFEFHYKDYYKSKDKHLYILANPLYKENQNSFFVLNYNFLANKLYHGVVFDFFKKLSSTKQSFGDFKSKIGNEFIEKILFRRVINSIFKEKFYKIFFDDGVFENFPDALVIRKNKFFIFEIKDALLSNETIHSNNYNKIKNEIDKFFVNRKGVSQIAKFLNRITNGQNSFIKISDLKVSKLEVIPIIIYTDTSFDLPGISDYLNTEFNMTLHDKRNFKKVNEILFVNIDFLIDNLDILSIGNSGLEKTIDKIYSLMRKRKRKSEKIKSIELLDIYHERFDQYFYSSSIIDEKRNSYVEFVFKELDIQNSF